MEMNSLEEEIRQVVRNRTISPSEDSRQKLSDLLAKPISTKKKIPWMSWAVAASIVIGSFLIGIDQLLNVDSVQEPTKISYDNQENSDINGAVVSQDEKIKYENNGSKIYNDSSLTEDIHQKSALAIEKKSTSLTNQFNLTTSQNDNRPEVEQFSLVENKNESTTEFSYELTSTSLDSSNSNSNQAETYKYITPNELLASVTNDSSSKLKSTSDSMSSQYINPDKLLTDMEGQLFMEANKGVLHKVGKELKKMKEAVANRNHQ